MNAPNDASTVIESKTVFEDLILSTKIQFSTDVAQVYVDRWIQTKELEAYVGSWQLCSDYDTCESSKKQTILLKIEMKKNGNSCSCFCGKKCKNLSGP